MKINKATTACIYAEGIALREDEIRDFSLTEEGAAPIEFHVGAAMQPYLSEANRKKLVEIARKWGDFAFADGLA